MGGYYPIFLEIKQKLCVVVGGGKVAERKVKGLLKAGARVKVIAPEVTSTIKDLAATGQIELHERGFQKGDLKGAWLAFAATNHRETQQAVQTEAEELRIFCNVVDAPQHSSFIVPSSVKRGRLHLAISTSGASPALARRLREQLEEIFGPEYEIFMELMARWRKEILEKDLPEEERRKIFEHLALSPIPLWIKRGEQIHIKALAQTYALSYEED